MKISSICQTFSHQCLSPVFLYPLHVSSHLLCVSFHLTLCTSHIPHHTILSPCTTITSSVLAMHSQASALSNHPRALIHWEAWHYPTPSLPYIMPWSCVFLVVSFVWWSAVTNQSWNFKLRNKSVCFSCCNRSPQGHSWGLSTVRKEDFLVWLTALSLDVEHRCPTKGNPEWTRQRD